MDGPPIPVGSRVRMHPGRAGEVTNGWNDHAGILWDDDTWSWTLASAVEVTGRAMASGYGRWTLRRRPLFVRLPDGGMDWRWRWVATSPYTLRGIPVTHTAGSMGVGFAQIADDERADEPWALGPLALVGRETP